MEKLITCRTTNPILPQRETAIHTIWVAYFRFRTLKHLILSIKSLWIKPFFLTWCTQINTKQSRETTSHNRTPTTCHQENGDNPATSTQVTEDRDMKIQGKRTVSVRWHYTTSQVSPVGKLSRVVSFQTEHSTHQPDLPSSESSLQAHPSH